MITSFPFITKGTALTSVGYLTCPSRITIQIYHNGLHTLVSYNGTSNPLQHICFSAHIINIFFLFIYRHFLTSQMTIMQVQFPPSVGRDDMSITYMDATRS
uniref:Uncharacterized protein n=1 Tax=Opuntia streptacantha TaxID=393608 RepID=A0A7C9DTZ0_OPUST